MSRLGGYEYYELSLPLWLCSNLFHSSPTQIIHDAKVLGSKRHREARDAVKVYLSSDKNIRRLVINPIPLIYFIIVIAAENIDILRYSILM